jgi:hypothetical protein
LPVAVAQRRAGDHGQPVRRWVDLAGGRMRDTLSEPVRRIQWMPTSSNDRAARRRVVGAGSLTGLSHRSEAFSA